jgi:signal transduction histidine kinase
MKIKTRLRLNTYISLCVLALVILSIAWSFRELSNSDRDIDLVEQMRIVAFQRTALRDDYLLYQEERAKIQWYAKSETLRELFETASRQLTRSEDKVLLAEARKDFDATLANFSQFMEKDKAEGRVAKAGFDLNEAESSLIGQVFLKAYSLSDNIGRLHELMLKERSTAQNRSIIALIITVLGGVFAIIINSAITNRILTERIATLAKGVEIIGAGNLDHLIDVKGNDELSKLARSSNEMAAKIQNLYVDLKKEIAERQAANKELEAFSYSVSHDLRTPLRAINGFSQAVIEDYADKLDDEGKRLLDVISDSAKKMGQLIDDLLTFSRVGRQEPRRQEIDMPALVNSVAQDLKQADPGRTIYFDFKPMPAAIGDTAMVRQVITNLLSNAIKFSKPRDAIAIEVGSSIENHENVYYVKDHGVGFDMQYADKLFGVFQRLHSQEKFEGTGVGLALVQRIVHRHGGRIWAEGKVNEGATFYFTLPGLHVSEQTDSQTKVKDILPQL